MTTPSTSTKSNPSSPPCFSLSLSSVESALSTVLKDLDYVVLYDLETTVSQPFALHRLIFLFFQCSKFDFLSYISYQGLHTSSCDILEFGAVVLHPLNFSELCSFHSLFRSKKITAGSTKANHITSEMVRNCKCLFTLPPFSSRKKLYFIFLILYLFFYFLSQALIFMNLIIYEPFIV